MFGRKTHRSGCEQHADPSQSSYEYASDQRATRPLPVPAAAARIILLKREEEKIQQTPWPHGRSETLASISLGIATRPHACILLVKMKYAE